MDNFIDIKYGLCGAERDGYDITFDGESARVLEDGYRTSMHVQTWIGDDYICGIVNYRHAALIRKGDTRLLLALVQELRDRLRGPVDSGKA